MSKQVQPQEEEIDLGSFFNQIGKLFSKLFTFIVSIFKGLYHFFILLLIFIRKNYLKLGLAIIIGLILGFLTEKYSQKKYRYEMILEPNYNASYQLNDRVQYYNQLITNKNYREISKLFSIDNEDAKSILKFEIKRLEEPKDIYESYDNFIKDKDSITISKIPFESYADKKFSYYNAKKYKFSMLLTKNTLKKNIEKELLADIENNANLKNQKTEMLNRLNEKEKNILKLMRDIDSIRANDKLIALTAAKNGNLSTTNIDVNKETKTDNKDISMFNIFKESYLELENVMYEKEKYSSIYKIVTPFEPLGKVEKDLTHNMIFTFSLISFIIASVLILSKKIVLFLDLYEKI